MRVMVVLIATVCVAGASAAQIGPDTIPALKPAGSLQSLKVLDRSARVEAFADWVSAVLNHVPGTADAAVQSTAQMTAASVDNLLTELVPLVSLMDNPQATAFSMPNDGKSVPQSLYYNAVGLTRLRGVALQVNAYSTDPTDFFERAALLHTDVALHPATLRPAPGAVTASSRAVIQFGDGAQLGVIETADHLRAARRLIRLVPRGNSHDADLRRWFQATMARQQADQFWDVAHGDAAVESFPDAPELLLLDGCLHEVLASAALRPVIERATMPSGSRLDVASPRAELRKASVALKRAVGLAPASVDARVRYGHVLAGLQQWADALSTLQALPRLSDPETGYYAALFLGDALEGAGRLDEARTEYRRAAALFPAAQSPALALAHLAWTTGDRAAAREHLQSHLASSSFDDDGRDPMWTYHTWQSRDADAWLRDAYSRLSQPGPPLKR